MYRRLTLLAAIAAICGGCVGQSDYVRYVIEITPTESGIERRVTVVRTMASDSTWKRVALRLGQAEAERLERVYGVRPDSVKPYAARGRFTTIPDDVGNWGTMRRYDSALGRAWLYAERFRGDPDPLAGLEARLSAADSVTDIVLGWANAALGQHPNWPALRSYIDGDLRLVLRNHSLQAWRADSTVLDLLLVNVLMHPTLWGLALFGDDDDVQARIYRTAALAELRDSFAKILGLKSRAEIDRVLRFVSRPDTAYQGLVQYIASSAGETPAAATARWSRITALSMHDASEVESDRADSLEIRLVVPPGHVGLNTNGTWDPVLHAVVWSGRVQELDNKGPVPPLVCHAEWAIPDSVRQHRVFGDVLLDDDELIAYCVWFETLDAAQKREWNRMLSRLRPGKFGPLERFKFSSGEAGGSGGDIPGRKLILDAAD